MIVTPRGGPRFFPSKKRHENAEPLLFAARVVLMMIALSLAPDTASAQPSDYRIGPDDVVDVECRM